MENLKQYKQLSIPEDSKWNKKVYNPFILLDNWLYFKFKYSWFYIKYDTFISTPVWNIINGIKNIVKWFPTIWKDRDYDQHYIFEILKQKLIFQREHLVNNNLFVGIKTVNRDITNCINLIERIQDEYYQLEYQDYCDNEMLFEESSEGNMEINFKTHSENYDEYFKKYKSAHNKMLKQYNWTNSDDKGSRALRLSHFNQQRCEKLLFKILNDRINHWWD